MVTLIRWRVALWRSEDVKLERARLFARISYAQLVLVFIIVMLATAVTRGVGV
jgi:putative membrane protein